MINLPHDTVTALAPSARKVYDYLMTGRTLTQLVAIGNLGVGSVTKRVSELRALGLDVKSEWQRDHNDKRYKKYWVEIQHEG